MASVSTDKQTGRRTIQFKLGLKRHSIRLGKVTAKQANTFKRHVEALVAASITGHPMAAETAHWVSDLLPEIKERIVRTGLLAPSEPGEKSTPTTLTDFVADYCTAREDDCEESTVRKKNSLIAEPARCSSRRRNAH